MTTSSHVHVNDVNTGQTFLLHTGADISVIPYDQSSRPSSNARLITFNGMPLKTYGPKILNVDFGLSRTLTWTFEMADVQRLIIGADFLRYYDLVDVRRNRLIDPNAEKHNRDDARLDHGPTASRDS